MDKDILQVNMTDHDLLITLHEQVKGLRGDVQSMGASTSKSMDELKEDVHGTLKDHENRLRRVELWGGILIGISYALQFYFKYLK